MSGKTPGPRTQLPYVLVNMAMTADGKITTVNRAGASFGSGHDHEHLLALRATADAVLAGARTVDLAPVNLGPGPARFRQSRISNGLAEYNLRIIVSGNGTLNPQADIFRHRFSPILILITERASTAKRRRLSMLADELKICGRSEVDFRRAFGWLRDKWGVNRLLCEGGGELNDALFRAGLVDELHLTVCPKVLGGRNAPTIADGSGFRRLASAFRLRIKSFQRIGDEIFAVFGKGNES